LLHVAPDRISRARTAGCPAGCLAAPVHEIGPRTIGSVRAARWHARGDVRVEDVPQPTPGPGELLLRVTWAGICGTDVEEYVSGPAIIPTHVPNRLTGRAAPVTLGHEFVGTVAALGEGVSDFRLGERVAPEVVLFCGVCFFCRRHEYALCINWAALGLMADGGLADYAVVPAATAARLPDTLSDEEGALVEPTEVAVRAIRKSELRLGESVAIVGGGTIGLLVLQVARAAGAANVHVIEPLESRRILALHLGATTAWDPRTSDTGEVLRDACQGVGPDIVFECAGGPGTANLAIQLARKGGRIVLVGIRSEPVPISTLDIVIGEKHLVGSVQHHYDEDLPTAVRLLAERRVQVGSLITGRIPLERVVDDGLRVLATPQVEPDTNPNTEKTSRHLKIIVGAQS
jgi:(R,R)-butanediol dehydrogenase / meso-butanediol dehydrogenase / diacetyl reductase